MELPEPSSYADRLKAAMGTRVTRDELAKACGISVQAVAQVLNGKTKALTAENTARAARLLDVDWFWLATGEGAPNANQEDEAEKGVLAALREIKRLDPETNGQLLARIEEIADGLKASDKLLRPAAGPRSGAGGQFLNPDLPAQKRAAR